MLINAHNPEELRVAVMDGDKLENFQIEGADTGLVRGNVYRGTVSNVAPALNAAFIDYGAERDGFLSIGDIVPESYHRQKGVKGRPRVQDVLERGKSLIVQVTKDAEGEKGAALTTNVSLAGRYLVFTPYDDTRGVSRKVEDDEARQKLKEQAAALKVPPGAGFIIRTNALDQTKATLTKDFSSLLRHWKEIEKEGREGKAARLLYNDQDIVVRVLRDHLNPSIEELLIDDEAAFDKASEYIRAYMPRTKINVIRYDERVPLFTRFNVEPHIEKIFERTVPLSNGGSIVIDRTEALVAIDVNSGRARGGSQEETGLATNLEAAEEVARQLRLRDIGGLIVVDFIDMRSPKHRASVEKTLKDAMKNDKARSSIGRISSNGLLEINRQRIQQALHLRTHRRCPTCEGTGRIASPEMVGLNLLRRIEARAVEGQIERVRISLHPELADSFQNSRRRQIAALETEFGIRIEIIASSHLHRPEQEIEWIERAASGQESHDVPKWPDIPMSGRDAPPVRAELPAAESADPGRQRSRRRGRKKRGHGSMGEVPSLPAAARSTEAASEWPDIPTSGRDAPPVRAELPAAEPVEPARLRSRRRGRKKRGHGSMGEVPARPAANQPYESAWVFHEASTESEEVSREDQERAAEFQEVSPGFVGRDEIPSGTLAPRARSRRRRRGRKPRGGQGKVKTKGGTTEPRSAEPSPNAEPLAEVRAGRVGSKKRRGRRRGRARGREKPHVVPTES